MAEGRLDSARAADGIRVERDGHVVTITIERPEAGNSLDHALLRALERACGALADDGTVRGFVLTGAGDKAFCAGADLKERAGMSDEQVRERIAWQASVITAVARLPMPAIAAINGAALGGGTELALACDIRIASTTASLGLTETTLAIIPGGGGTQRLPRLVGPGRAKELIFSGRRVSAAEGLQYGLVEEVVAPDELRARARALAHQIARNGPVAVRAAKEAIVRGIEMPLDEALRLETALYDRTIGTKDRLEGLAAFREKRAPEYRGE